MPTCTNTSPQRALSRLGLVAYGAEAIQEHLHHEWEAIAAAKRSEAERARAKREQREGKESECVNQNEAAGEGEGTSDMDMLAFLSHNADEVCYFYCGVSIMQCDQYAV